MSPAGLHFEAETPLGRHRRNRRGLRRFGLGAGLSEALAPGAHPDVIMNGARARADAKAFAQRGGDLPVRPAALTQLADQLRIGLQFAAWRPRTGFGEKGGDLFIQAHVWSRASTVRLCSIVSGRYSGMFGDVRRVLGLRAVRTRIYPNSVRVCSASFGGAQAALDILRLGKSLRSEDPLTTCVRERT